jgi:hypothetical protein
MMACKSNPSRDVSDSCPKGFWRNEQQKPGLDGRARDANGTISQKRGDTEVGALRRIYGPEFARGPKRHEARDPAGARRRRLAEQAPKKGVSGYRHGPRLLFRCRCLRCDREPLSAHGFVVAPCCADRSWAHAWRTRLLGGWGIGVSPASLGCRPAAAVADGVRSRGRCA